MNNLAKKLLFLGTMVPLLTLTACMHGGFHNAQLAAHLSSRQVTIGQDDFPARYRPQLAAVLDKHGFKLLSEDQSKSGDLTLRTCYTGGPAKSATVYLMSGTNVLVRGGALNAGWGTLIASDSAKNSIIDSAIDSFEKHLSKIQPPAPPVAFSRHE